VDDQYVEIFLKENRIIDSSETYETLRERVIETVIEKEHDWGTSEREQNQFRQRLERGFCEREFIPSTTILTNAGRYEDKSLTACSVPPIDLHEDLTEIREVIDYYHEQGMGAGFNFDDVEDPVSTLFYLNEIAVEGIKSGEQDRPVGNMGVISVDHPKIVEFIQAKDNEEKNKNWIFNISINIPEEFMRLVKTRENYFLSDGKKINSSTLMDLIAESACSCGDPGLVFLERFERDNPAPHLGKYKSIAPCGEIAMAEGETCQFSYINVSAYVRRNLLDYERLKETIFDVVRFLDDTLDKSIEAFGNKKSKEIMSQKRKIGVGICGFADLLIQLRTPYESQEALNIARDVMSFITYNTKVSSVDLAKERGPFPAFHHPETRIGKGYILRRYGGLESATVSKEDWKQLDKDIQNYGIRHISTTALPPTGRSSRILGVSPSIEPLFAIELTDTVRNTLGEMLNERGYSIEEIEQVYRKIEKDGTCSTIKGLPHDIMAVFKPCLEISPEAHLAMVAEFQKFTDESIAKTVNVVHNTSPSEIRKIFMKAYDLELKGITVYRDGSKAYQPKSWANKK
jgi:ribonucleoside-diphosphate reductase alpha chain